MRTTQKYPLAFTEKPKIASTLVSQVQSSTRVLRVTLTILLMQIVLNSNASASSASLSLTRTDTLLWAKPPSAYPSVDEILGNTEAVHGRIMVAEIAAESTWFARSNILVQSSASMTAQANQLSSLAFTLIQ